MMFSSERWLYIFISKIANLNKFHVSPLKVYFTFKHMVENFEDLNVIDFSKFSK